MPIPLLGDLLFKGVHNVPFAVPILKTLPCLLIVWLLKIYFGGARNTSERLMRSKVIMITVPPPSSLSYKYPTPSKYQMST